MPHQNVLNEVHENVNTENISKTNLMITMYYSNLFRNISINKAELKAFFSNHCWRSVNFFWKELGTHYSKFSRPQDFHWNCSLLLQHKSNCQDKTFKSREVSISFNFHILQSISHLLNFFCPSGKIKTTLTQALKTSQWPNRASGRQCVNLSAWLQLVKWIITVKQLLTPLFPFHACSTRRL